MAFIDIAKKTGGLAATRVGCAGYHDSRHVEIVPPEPMPALAPAA